MEKVKISAYQLFVLLFLFEMGTAIFVPLAIDAKQDAWLAILIGMAGGICLFLIYHRIFAYYPDLSPPEYLQMIFGQFLGKIVTFLYLLYFLYLEARVLRDFGEMLAINFYPETPILVLIGLMMLTVVIAVRNGIEVMARTAELLFVVYLLLSLAAFLLLLLSGVVDIQGMKPVLENGLKPVIKTAFSQTLYFPFGEALAFILLLPYVGNVQKAKKAGVFALLASGISLALLMTLNISVLGVSLASRSLFPLLSTIQSIEVAGFLQRLDIFFMLGTVIAGFFKIAIFLYIVVAGTAELFKIKESSRLVFQITFIALPLSMIIASDLPEHFMEGLKIVPVFLHLPMQVILPIIVLVLAFFKNRKKEKQSSVQNL